MSGCIGAGLDCSYVVLVLRDGFPTSMIDFIQEMGRCGRSRNEEIENDISILDSFHLIISLPSLTYLLERIFVDCTLSTDELAFRESVISVNDSNKMQVDNILEVVSFIFNSTQCWHLTIEELCANDELENSLDTTIHQPCNHMCPWCNKALDVFIKPINKRGLIQFLVHVFIENNYSNITPMMLCTQLKTYASVGSAIYRTCNCLYKQYNTTIDWFKNIESRSLYNHGN